MSTQPILLAAADIIGGPGTVNSTGSGNTQRITQTGSGSGSLDAILTNFWNTNTKIAFLIITIIAIFVLATAAMRYVAAKGDPAKVTLARNTLIQTTFGIALLVASTAVVSVILSIINTAASAAK